MADVVEQRGDLDVVGDAGLELQAPGHTLRDVERAERVAEPRVLGAGIDQPREAHLLDPAEPLDRPRIEEVGDRAIVAVELDEPVNRVTEHAVFDHAAY